MANPIIEIPADVDVLDMVKQFRGEKDYTISNDLKIITSYPVIVDDTQISEKVYSYQIGDVTPDKGKEVDVKKQDNVTFNTGKNPVTSETPTSTPSSGKKGLSADTISAGANLLGQLGTALAGRQRTYTDVEQRCGKKPLGKKKLAEWNKCAQSSGGSSGAPIIPDSPAPAPTPSQGLSKGAKIGIAVGGLVVVGLVIFLVVKSGKSTGK